MKYRQVMTDEVVKEWSQIFRLISDLLKRFPEYNEPDGSDILRALLLGHYFLFVAEDEESKWKMICVAEIIQFPRTRSFRIQDMVGEWLPNMDEALEWLLTWARERGCTFAEFLGRPGWDKYLKTQGFTVRQYNFTRNL